MKKLQLWKLYRAKVRRIWHEVFTVIRLKQRNAIFPTESERKTFSHYYVTYTYGRADNLGDWIQSKVTQDVILNIEERAIFTPVNRERLLYFLPELRHICLMQGWYEHHTLAFLPQRNVLPVWVGTHFDSNTRSRLELILKLNPRFFQGETIGCRDLSTLEWCVAHGIDAYFSRCLTLTFPKRSAPPPPERARVFFVNCPEWILYSCSNELKENAVHITQRECDLSALQKSPYEEAKDLLERYRTEARLVVTTLLHCAQPCIAMGIPVVFISPDYDTVDRFSSMKGLIPIWTRAQLENNEVNFKPECPDIEPLKEAIKLNVQLSIAQAKRNLVDVELLKRTRDFIFNFTCE